MKSIFVLFRMVGRSFRQHAFSTTIVVATIALASGLVMSVFSIQAQSKKAFQGGSLGFDAVLGARGSKLQLVLNSVFHLETSPGNISWSMYQTIKKNPFVSQAIPYAVGDNYRGFRIVATVPDLFKNNNLQINGKIFNENKREAIIGSFVAQKLRLEIGSTFNPYHGVVFNESMRHKETYTITGILKPTNSPADRVIWIPLEGLYRMGGHVLRGTGEAYTPAEGEAIADEHKEVSAVMLKLKSPQAGFFLDQTINKQGKVATLAWPVGTVMADLFEKMGWVNKILLFVAYLVVVIVAGSILASIYNTIHERRRTFAILRALGAHKRTIFSLIILESGLMAFIGSLGGFVIYMIIESIAAFVIRAQTGVVLSLFWFHPIFIWGPVGITGIGFLAGILPAIKAYQTEIATNLTPTT